jgi:glycosyltransferase involved in cell wall biosynthesis
MTNRSSPTRVPDAGIRSHGSIDVVRVSVIIPALNEADCIGEVIAQAKAHADADVLVIDDGSTDETAAIAMLRGARVLRAPLWQGAWGAIQTGMRYAVRHGYTAVVTMDAERTEHAVGYVVVDDARITAVGEGPASRQDGVATYVDGRGCLATPGLVNTHHHLYQWLTRGFAVDHTLFQWLTTLYPVWACLDEDTVRTGATGALAQLARTGCSTTMPVTCSCKYALIRAMATRMRR